MASPKTSKLRRKTRRHRKRSCRRGSLIIEAVICALLLATATYAVTKLARSAVVLSHQSDQRLAAKLAAENTIERLRLLTLDELANRADEAATAVGEVSRCTIQVSVEPFNTGGVEGIHIRATAKASENVHVIVHDWRFSEQASDATASGRQATGDSSGERADA